MLQKIFVGGKWIYSKQFSQHEEVWQIVDVPLILECFYNMNKVVLGGDIFNAQIKHTYDSWYYEYDTNMNWHGNSLSSYKKAIDYIKKYIAINGASYYVCIVTKRTLETLP